MKIGILADIHGNQFALESVLEIAKKEKVEKFLILGDVVGYYYYPNRVLDLINDWDYLLIKGNHEEILSDIIKKKAQESDIRIKYGSGHRMAMERLSEDQLKMLFNAPEKMMVEFDGIKILMCHGSPWQADFYLYPSTEKSILSRCEDFDADMIFCGHSHYPFTYKSDSCILVNCGSVGQARNLGGYAFWSILNTENRVIQSMATPYDTGPLIKEIEAIDPEMPYLKDILLRK